MGRRWAYLAPAHNERDPATGTPRAKVIHNFGRADRVDREALGRLVRSISRFLDPGQAVAAAVPGEVDILHARPMGAAYLADRLWAWLGIGTAIRRVAAGRRLDETLTERVIFAMVANRLSASPLSKLAGAAWVTDPVFIPGLPAPSEGACHRGMDVLLDTPAAVQEEVFFAVANLLNLEVDLLFFDAPRTPTGNATARMPSCSPKTPPTSRTAAQTSPARRPGEGGPAATGAARTIAATCRSW